MNKKYTIAVAGTGYVGLSVATLLSQNHRVYAVDIIPEKVEKINNRKSPIQDKYIEKHLSEKELDLTATLDAETAYKAADFVGFEVDTRHTVYHTFHLGHQLVLCQRRRDSRKLVYRQNNVCNHQNGSSYNHKDGFKARFAHFWRIFAFSHHHACSTCRRC